MQFLYLLGFKDGDKSGLMLLGVLFSEASELVLFHFIILLLIYL